MRYLRCARQFCARHCNWLLVASITLATCLAVGSVAWADSSVPAAPAEKSYVLPYFVVVLACALGLMLVCRSSHRTTEIKEPGFDD